MKWEIFLNNYMICDINIFLAGLDFAFLGLYASAGIGGPIICYQLLKTIPILKLRVMN